MGWQKIYSRPRKSQGILYSCVKTNILKKTHGKLKLSHSIVAEKKKQYCLGQCNLNIFSLVNKEKFSLLKTHPSEWVEKDGCKGRRGAPLHLTFCT